MKYYSKKLNTNFEDAVEITKAKLKDAGFGVLSEIDINEKFKEKLDVDFRKYKIMGACSPPNAYEAINADKYIGTMLPCSVIVQEHSENNVEVTAIDAVASMKAVENEKVQEIASKISKQLEDVINSLSFYPHNNRTI